MIYTNFYALPDYNKREIFRYAGYSKSFNKNEPAEEVLDECMTEFSQKKIRGRVCYIRTPITIKDEIIDFYFAEASSKSLVKNLHDCNEAIIFAATIGIEIDRLIKKYQHTDLPKAVFMQAIGAERIEALCNTFCNDIKQKEKDNGLYVRPRFSPGYGDLSIELQRDIIRTLDCSRKIGITLNDSLLMSPSKSVTAIVGLCNKKCTPDTEGCDYCESLDCPFRKQTSRKD